MCLAFKCSLLIIESIARKNYIRFWSLKYVLFSLREEVTSIRVTSVAEFIFCLRNNILRSIFIFAWGIYVCFGWYYDIANVNIIKVWLKDYKKLSVLQIMTLLFWEDLFLLWVPRLLYWKGYHLRSGYNLQVWYFCLHCWFR